MDPAPLLDPVRLLPAAGRAAAPWSNGGGTTREIAAGPPGAGWSTFAWRVSLADVDRDGPYSPLPGVRRILTMVAGAGMELTVDGVRTAVTERFRPVSFAGGAATDCRLAAGPVVNFNVMVRDGRCTADVVMARGRHAVCAAPGPDGAVLVVAVAGETLLTPAAAGEPVRLGRYDAALLAAGTAADLDAGPDGVAAVVTLVPSVTPVGG
ncbi:HutD/Ves family protein [Streptomyces olivaceiscleroticus]|uniref:HutD-family protein n=1 Tax=Streptomyces olivaceiscleroticus TaxID=68245 RepID=A0ABN0ZPW0_9ACTN